MIYNKDVEGGAKVIVYKDVIGRLAAAGYSTYRIRKEKVVSESTMQKLRTGGALSTDTIDTLCRVIGCQPGDLMEYVPDN
ncbi:helix-turn-helix domain-containing protein [Allofournierella sp.]|uniref:helix-turn-helix domain-containing protein n=1 Tax=Allofournierella sp. TaxID=1940256 RepID=UPI003AEFAAF2